MLGHDEAPTAVRGFVPASVAHRIVLLAGHAPSVYNTQPWAWRLRPDGMDLYADYQRRLSVADPTGRELIMSCGAALHHAQVAARALGWAATVRRFPDPSAPALLAEVRLAPALPPRSAAADIRAIHERTTDRRRFTSWPVPVKHLERLAAEARDWDTDAVAVNDVTDRFRLELLVSRALQLQARDPAVLAEQEQWLDRRRGDGVPTATLPDRPAADESHASRFGVGTLEDGGRDVQGTDSLILLCTDADTPAAWLRGGEGMSALWLHAVRNGLSVVPLSQVVEVPETRAGLRHEVLGGANHPLLLLRVGWQAIGRSQLVATPRRPLDHVLLP